MGKVIYYVAMSVDGRIAGPNGDLGWLLQYDSSGEDYGYQRLLAGLEALVMGSTTYEWVLEHGGDWAYKGLDVVVMTSRSLPQPAGGNVRFTDESPEKVVSELRSRYSKNIWLVGGGKLAGAFIAAGVLDEYEICIMPVILGAGVPLVQSPGSSLTEKLRLVEHEVFPSGVVRLRYVRRAEAK